MPFSDGFIILFIFAGLTAATHVSVGFFDLCVLFLFTVATPFVGATSMAGHYDHDF